MPCRSTDDNNINMFHVYPVLQQPALGLGLRVLQMFLRRISHHPIFNNFNRGLGMTLNTSVLLMQKL
jgi:hypothetical protein